MIYNTPLELALVHLRRPYAGAQARSQLSGRSIYVAVFMALY
jgi:hypothetical protein